MSTINRPDFRRPLVWVAVVVAASLIYLVVLASSHFDEIVGRVGPRTPRTILLQTTLPISKEIFDGRMSPGISADSTYWAIGRIDLATCHAALTIARKSGYLPINYDFDQLVIGYPTDQVFISWFPMPGDSAFPARTHVDSMPAHGFYSAHSRRANGKRNYDFSWIDSDDCRVFHIYATDYH